MRGGPRSDGPKERRSTPRGQMSASSDSKPSLAALDNALKQHFKEPAPLAKLTLFPARRGVSTTRALRACWASSRRAHRLLLLFLSILRRRGRTEKGEVVE